MTLVKLCGMTRAEDVAAAADAGADYVGVIFAGGPRHLDPAQAIEVLAPARGRLPVIGVFGADAPGRIADVARAASLDGVQLHGDPSPADVDALRRLFDGMVWAVCRVRDAVLPAHAGALFTTADAVVLDAHADAALGGTGRVLPWDDVEAAVRPLRRGRAVLVLAGGLRAANVAMAVGALAPDIVDVSSGIESAPGRKDHGQMRAFIDAARTAAPAPRS